MADDRAVSPLKRRVPGATGASPVPTAPQALPDNLIARMQAAVEAAHAAHGAAGDADDPVTEPMPTLQAAVTSQDWPTAELRNGPGQRGDAWTFRRDAGQADRHHGGITGPDEAEALDDLAESYLAADPDLAAGYFDDASLDDAGLDDAEPGTGVRLERAGWWDHAVQSRRAARADEPGGHETRPRLAPTAELPTPRRRRARPTGRGHRRGWAFAGVALAVALVAGGAVVLASRDGGGVKTVHSGASRAAKARATARLAGDVASAATWVARQVGHAAKVACDPVMCRALANHRVPARRLDELRGSAAPPFGAKVIVDTPALRRQVGASQAASWAPIVLSAFGLGADRITVRVLAPHGADAYEAALRADRKERQAAGSSLLTSSQITTTRAARSALATGEVDDRLLLVITALASHHPIDIVAFSRTWPGASAGVPMRCAYLAEEDQAAYLTKAVYVQAMIDLLRAQPLAYRPVHIGLVRLAGRDVLSLWYPGPSPLGLITTYP